MTETDVCDEIKLLAERSSKAKIPPELHDKVERLLTRLKRMLDAGSYSGEYESTASYVDWVTSLPWVKSTEDNLDLLQAKSVLDKNHYGMEIVKDRILEYLSTLILTSERRQGRTEVETGPLASSRASVICFLGLPGVGKTSVAYSIAEALGRNFIRIAMGGMGDASQLRGLPRVVPSAEPGLVIKGLRRAGSNNPVILLDEVDRVSEGARSGISGVLLELLDPEQNSAFSDYYLDYPFDLSRALFLISCNSTRDIAGALLDRFEVIEMPAYSDKEKEIIGRDYLLPRAMVVCGLSSGQLGIDGPLWPEIIRPLGYDAGIRTLDRTIQTICRRAARKIVEGKEKKFMITRENIKEFIQ